MYESSLSLNDFLCLDEESNALKFIKQQPREDQSIFHDIYECPQSVLQLDDPTEEMLLFAITQDWRLIKPIKQSYEICLLAVLKNGNAIKFVRDCFLDEEMIKAAYSSSDSPAPFEKLEIELQTYQICKEAVFLNPMNLKHVRCSLKNEELYKIAVDGNALAIQYINSPSEDLVNSALDKNGIVISKLLQNKDRCLRALKQNPGALEFIDPKYLTQEMVDEALTRCPEVFRYVPAKFQNPKNCLEIINKNPRLVDSVKIVKKGSLNTVVANLNQLLIKETIEKI